MRKFSRVMFGLAGVLVAAVAGLSHAGTYYVAANGSRDNDGSSAKPWPSVEFALRKVGGGHTIVLKPGIYPAPITVTTKAAGTEQSPTVIKSEKKWKAVIAGANPHGHGMGTNQDCAWVVFDGFEVLGSADGISLNGPHGTARNCWTHHNWAMGISSHGTKGAVIENNLIEYNGQHPHLHHGVYADSEGMLIRNNIVRHNAAFGLHCYPAVKNAVIANNVVHDNGSCGILVACPRGGGKNLVVNNTSVDNPIAIAVSRGNGERLYNNIAIGVYAAIDLSPDSVNSVAHYNLCKPASRLQGSHGLSANPGFVTPDRDCFWLKADSAARGKGNAEYAPKTDFWGRARPADKSPDLGALAYTKYWSAGSNDEQSSNRGYFGWPYRFATQKGWEIRDFWFLPEGEKK